MTVTRRNRAPPAPGRGNTTQADGPAGVPKLDYNSVKAEAKGCKTTTRRISASRSYANLSDVNHS